MRWICLLLAALPLAGQECLVSGRVVDTSGNAVPRAQVRLQSPAGSAAEPSGLNGEYCFREVPEGNYSVWAEKPGWLIADPMRVRPVAVEAGKSAVREIVLARLGVIAGMVMGPDGQGHSGVSVQAWIKRYSRGQYGLHADRSATTDEAGRFRIHGLLPGTYAVSATDREPMGQPQRPPARHFHPGVLRPATGNLLDLRPGAVLEGVDIQVAGGGLPEVVVETEVPQNCYPGIHLEALELGAPIDSSLLRTQQKGGVVTARGPVPRAATDRVAGRGAGVRDGAGSRDADDSRDSSLGGGCSAGTGTGFGLGSTGKAVVGLLQCFGARHGSGPICIFAAFRGSGTDECGWVFRGNRGDAGDLPDQRADRRGGQDPVGFAVERFGPAGGGGF